MTDDSLALRKGIHSEIHFYGERGLVDALFLDLRTSLKTVEFLRQIEFSSRVPCYLDIPDKSKIMVIVEAGFGGNRAGFGRPDAVIVAVTPDGRRLVFFLEAKAGLYMNEAQDYSEREAGFNSKINGQFTLRFRLAQALRQHQNVDSRLVEPEGLARAYGEEKFPRRLVKVENLRDIVRPHLLNASSYFFVALTDDSANVWRIVETENPKILPFLAEPLPADSVVVGSDWSADRNIWKAYSGDFGWISFRSVESLVGDGEFFRHARQFLDAKRSLSRAEIRAGLFRNIRTRNWKDFLESSPTIRIRNRLRASIEQAIQGTDLIYTQEAGSDSLIGLGSQRLLKLITPVVPYTDAAILVGVSVDTNGFPEDFRKRSRGVVGIRNRGFEVIGISENDFSGDSLREFVRDTIANILDWH